jgi:site-specific DNA-methyltransferase (adenine-specific)
MTPYFSESGIVMMEGDALDLQRQCASSYIDAIITDPPFMLGAASARKSADKALGWADINNASRWYSEWIAESWRILKSDGCLWTFANWRLLPVLHCAAARVPGLSVLSHVVWDKQWISVGSTRGLREQCELVVLFGKPDFSIPDRGIGNIWPEKWTSAKPSGHPQEKPVALIQRMITTSNLKPGSVIADWFMGRGSTAVACVNTEMRFLGAELEPDHLAVARDRVIDANLKLFGSTPCRQPTEASP